MRGVNAGAVPTRDAWVFEETRLRTPETTAIVVFRRPESTKSRSRSSPKLTRPDTRAWSSARGRRCRCEWEDRRAVRASGGCHPAATERETTVPTIREADTPGFVGSLRRLADASGLRGIVGGRLELGPRPVQAKRQSVRALRTIGHLRHERLAKLVARHLHRLAHRRRVAGRTWCEERDSIVGWGTCRWVRSLTIVDLPLRVARV